MVTPILATKLYIPSRRPRVVLRPHLIARLNEGLHRRLTLISAPAGFGKTTLVSEWSASCGRPVAWLALDEGDNDPTRFLAHLVAAVQTIAAQIGAGVLGLLQAQPPPPSEAILTALLNEIATTPTDFVLILDDYHVIDAPSVDHALTFLIEHLPPRMHLAIATREDPQLPLARLRARSQLTELRVRDLRFTHAEAAQFLTTVMGLHLSASEIAALEARTEGWIAGLQLAAISLQGHPDAAHFITSFTGSHHFVLDYLVEEVLQQQSERVQTFLLRTSILDRLCGPLCDAVLRDPAASGQATLEYIEHANLFLVPLDSERRWYRYHHLFADLLRQRLAQSAPAGPGAAEEPIAALHLRASTWYEANGLEVEAFQHAAAANAVERAARLAAGTGMPLHFRGAAAPVLKWLETLPTSVMDARPALWVMHALALSISGRNTGVEARLQAAEAALHGIEPDEQTRDLVGQIAAIRAMIAAPQYEVETIIAQARRALEHLAPDNLPLRTTATCALGLAYQFQGDRAAARQTHTDAIAMSQASGNIFVSILSTTCLGIVQEADNQLVLADQSYRRAMHLADNQPQPILCEAYFGVARIGYEWNDLETAWQYGQQSLLLAQQIEAIDSPIAVEVFLARLKLAQGDSAGAAALLARADQTARQHNFAQRLPEIGAAQVLTLLHQGDPAAAAHLAQEHNLPISQARVHLAQGDPSAALAVLEPARQEMEARGWQNERLRIIVLQAVALAAQGEQDQALPLLEDALALAEPGGFIRLFVDEGLPLAKLLLRLQAGGSRMQEYLHRLLAASGTPQPPLPPTAPTPQPLAEPLSQRELEILHLIAQGLSNREISERLFLALDTVKGHNRRMYDKLDVQRRTEAVARARELGLL